MNEVALSFYNVKLRHDPNLRLLCSDRHVLDETIDSWKAGLRLDGLSSKVIGISRSAIIYSLKTRWKLVDTKVNEANVVIWTADLVGHDKADHAKAKRIAKIVEKIRDSRMEMEKNRNGIIVDGFEEWENVVCRPGERLTRRIEVRNESDYDVQCEIKGDAATKQGFVIEGDMRFVLRAGLLGEGSRRSIVLSFLAPRNNALGVKKSLLVFNFEAIDFDYDEDDSAIASFSIVRYLYLRVGDPDDYEILKPSSPYVRKRNQFYDNGNKFSNPVRVEGGAATNPGGSFVVPLARYLIPRDVIQLAAFEKDAIRERFDKMFRKGRGGERDFVDARYEEIDYSSYLNFDNYATCMQHLLWMEEVQMNGASVEGQENVFFSFPIVNLFFCPLCNDECFSRHQELRHG